MAQPKTFLDFLSSAQDGVNSGVSPLLLQKSQIAFGNNCSIRGGYLTNRPPVIKRDFIFASPLDQATVEQGLFQGGGYYRPDYGTEQLIAHISGHLFSFTDVGGKFTVADISVPGDFNSAIISQVWMWQAEKWLIVQSGDGRLPIFYDGTTSRRSYGDSVLLGTTAADNINIHGINPRVPGEYITVTLTVPYTGPLNVPVLFNGAYYQTSQSLLGYEVILTNVTAPAAITVPTGTGLFVAPNYLGTMAVAASPNNVILLITLQNPVALPLNSNVLLIDNTGTQYTFAVQNGSGKNWVLLFLQPVAIPNQLTFPAGTVIISAAVTNPTVQIGKSTKDFVIPAIGGSVLVYLDNPYSGFNGQTVFINGYSYTIQQAPIAVSSVDLFLKNLTDVSTITIPSGTDILSVPELPAGRMGAYGLQQNWMSLTDGLSFIFSDISGSASGTQANNWRDAVLKTTQLTFGAGSFSIPSSGEFINSIWFTANLDTALGQGPVQIGTDSTIFSCLAPIDAAVLATITSPILTESLIGNGPTGQDSTVLVNSDTFFRSTIGEGSLVLARRDFVNNSWGNKPISNEMQRIYNKDDKSLLNYASRIAFDNRSLATCSPNSSAQGIYHRGLTSLNFDLLSSLRGDLPPSWEGIWTGLNVLKIIKGKVSGSVRAFAFTVNNTTNKIELYELLHESTTSYLDNDTTPIVWNFETAIVCNKDIKPLTELCQLNDGEVYLSDIKGTVQVEVQYRPDFYPCWTTWRKFTVCADATKPGYRMRIGLGCPDVTPCEAGNNRPLRVGHFFQFRVVITGSCQWMGMQPSAVTIPQPQFAPVECTVKPCQSFDCSPPDDFGAYTLQS